MKTNSHPKAIEDAVKDRIYRDVFTDTFHRSPDIHTVLYIRMRNLTSRDADLIRGQLEKVRRAVAGAVTIEAINDEDTAMFIAGWSEGRATNLANLLRLVISDSGAYTVQRQSADVSIRLQAVAGTARDINAAIDRACQALDPPQRPHSSGIDIFVLGPLNPNAPDSRFQQAF